MLEQLKVRINWAALLAPLEKKIKESGMFNERGRKPFSLQVIVRCFILQHLYNLSDPRLEEEIADRRSFQMFLELNMKDRIPDETTICRWRERFARLELDKLLFDSLNKQLKRRNMILERGTIIDATIKEAQAKPDSKRDKDADFTQKGGKNYYGYKGHIGTDLGTDTIHSVEFTSARPHDSTQTEKLIHGKEQTVYADKAYDSKTIREKLKESGVTCGILKRGARNRRLTKEEIGKNRQLSRIRNRVERPFAYMKRVLNYARCSYYDLKRNRFEFVMKSVLYNMSRMMALS
jgi:IS5 family transposase